MISSSLLRTFVFFIGHLAIDLTVVYTLTAATIYEAGLAATVGPIINSFWFYLLDRIWVKK